MPVYEVYYVFTDTFIDDVYKAVSKATRDGPHSDSSVNEELVKRQIKSLLSLSPREGICLLAYEQDSHEVVGVCAGMLSTHPLNPEELNATEIIWWVDKNHRNSRVGLDLLKGFEKWAEQSGAKRISLACYAEVDNTETIKKLYSKRGYKEVEITFTKELK